MFENEIPICIKLFLLFKYSNEKKYYIYKLTFSSSQSKIFLLIISNSTNSISGLFPKISSECNQIKILVDVVHNLDFQEGLSCKGKNIYFKKIIHMTSPLHFFFRILKQFIRYVFHSPASSMISQLSLDSAIFSLSCLIPVPIGGGPFLSITLSHSALAFCKKRKRKKNVKLNSKIVCYIFSCVIQIF